MTNRKSIRSIVLACILGTVLLVAGCRTAPVHNIVNAPIVPAGTSHPSTTAVKQAIIKSGTSLGWAMVPSRPGHITGTLLVRTHKAVVDIAYTRNDYDITYVDSTNLKYDGKKIHNNYNGWVMRLDRAIRTELAGIK